MPSVCFYFQVHQPWRLKEHSLFDIGSDHNYFNHQGDGNLNNVWVLNKVAQKCYLPTNELLLELLNSHPEFKVSYSFSGVFLEQIEQHAPEVLESFKKLVNTGQVEVLSETFHHSLSFLYSVKEFRRQVRMHKKLTNVDEIGFGTKQCITNRFGIKPKYVRRVVSIEPITHPIGQLVDRHRVTVTFVTDKLMI